MCTYNLHRFANVFCCWSLSCNTNRNDEQLDDYDDHRRDEDGDMSGAVR